MLIQGTVRAFVSVAALLALVGCSQDEPAPLESEVSTSDSGGDGRTEELRQDILHKLASERGIADPPDVALVRWITQQETASVMAECLTEEGFPASVADDGGMEVEYNSDQETTFDIAVYSCTARFPMQSEAAGVPPEAYIRGLYDHYVAVVVPCIEGEGEDVGDVPTWETFRDTFIQPSQQWHPYAALMESDRMTPAIESACPATPEGS